MAITLGSNVASLRGSRQLAKTSNELGTVFGRLSSGQRINKASDDAAGVSIADSLNARSRIYNQGVRNLNDGLSLLSIADSAIENLSDIMIRLEELAEQAANGVYTNKQRKAMDDEAQALSKEFFRISKTTEFNGQKLLSGEFDAINLQAGVGTSAILSGGVGGAIGVGTFGNSVSYALSSDIGQDVVLGDLNGDGYLDMVSAEYVGGVFYGGSVTVRLGRGDGSFGAATSYQSDNSPNTLTLGDLNADGVLDLVTGELYGATAVRLGTGDGRFGSAATYATGSASCWSVSLGDLNGDGILDLVAAGYAPGDVTVRLGRRDGGFGTAISYSMNPAYSNDVALGDLNGDGILDIVAVGNDYYGGSFATVRIGRGDGSFGTATSYVGRESGVALGDLNGDGKLDLVTIGFAGASIQLGNGNGTFGSATTYSGGSADVSLSDLNGDGILDLLTAEFRVRLGTGDGTFGASTLYTMGGAAIATGDLNGDGVPDIVTVGGSNSTVRLSITTDGVQPLLPFSLKMLADARQALPVFKQKRDQLAAQRGEIGAFQSRTDVAINVLQVSSENFKAAESRIRDADIAEESSRLVRLNILQQAASSVLAQANQQPALALQLLGG